MVAKIGRRPTTGSVTPAARVASLCLWPWVLSRLAQSSWQLAREVITELREDFSGPGIRM